MPEGDRFSDLGPGPGGERRPTAGERLAELDRTDPEPPDGPEAEGPAGPPPPPRRYTWVVGVAFTLLVLYAVFTAATNDDSALYGLPSGSRVPDFAAPLATGPVEGDVNLRQRRGSPEGDEPPACDVRGPGIVNGCDMRAKPLVLTWTAIQGRECLAQLDVLERVRGDYPQANFLAVIGGKDRAEIAAAVRRRGLGYPVAIDRDLQLSNALRVGVCPTTTFARPGGRVARSLPAFATERQVRDAVKRILPRRG